MPTATNAPRTAAARCPGCLTPTRPVVAPHCPSCGIWLAGPQAAELRWIDTELTRVDVARTWLISRRAALLDELIRLARQPGPATPPPVSVEQPSLGPDGGAADPTVRAQHHRPEMSGRTAARLLLAAGAALVAIAAAIFAVAGWSRFGLLGRCAILLAATALVLSAPRPLARRGLRATAEAVGAVGLAMTLADAFLIQRFTGLEAGLLPIAAFCGAMAAAWAAYGAGTVLRGPRLAALGLAQLSAPFALAGVARLLAGPDAPLAGPIAAGLVASAAVDAVFAGGRPARRPRWPRAAQPRAAGLPCAQPGHAAAEGRSSAAVPALAAAVATWTAGVLVAAAGLVSASFMPAFVPTAGRAAAPAISAGGVWWLGLACAAAAAVGALVPRRRASFQPLARPAAVISGALAALGLAIPAATVVPARWGVAVTGACGFCVSVAVLAVRRGGRAGLGFRAGTAGLPPARRLDLAAGSAATLAVATLIALPAALAALLPPHPLFPVWAGEVSSSRGAAGLFGAWQVPAATVLLTLCAAGCLIARFMRGAVPARFGAPLGTVAIASAALAAGSLPAAGGLTGWPALILLTAGATVLLIGGTRSCDRLLAMVAVAGGVILAVQAALWSLATPATTLAGLAALALAFGVAAVRSRHVGLAAITTAGAFAATVALAWSAPLAAGWPARSAALAGFAAAAAAVAAATVLHKVLPVHSVVLDLGAALATLLSAGVAAGQQDAFTFVALAAAVIASGTAWLRTGPRRVAAAAVTAAAALAALAASWRTLALALLVPAQILTHPWHGVAASHHHGLALAVVVLGVSLAALVSAVGALYGTGRASLDAAAVALPLIAAPAGAASMAGGLGYLAVTGLLLVLTAALTAWAAAGESLAPAGAAVASAALTIAWALAAPLPTLLVLGCLAACYGLCALRARLGAVRIAAGCLCVLMVTAFAECLAFATGLAAWQAGLAALAVGAAAQATAALLARRRSRPAGHGGGPAGLLPGARAEVSIGIEITGWLTAGFGAGQCLGRPWTACAAIGLAGLICLGVAARADRRRAAWAGVGLCYVAWCTGLTTAGVTLPEAYTCPAALIALAAGALVSRREPRPHSWISFGPGLALLLLPSLAAAWQETGWIRPAVLGLAGVVVSLGGARTRTQAPLLAGAFTALLVAGRELAPGVLRLVHLLPGWVPVAIGGAVLLWAGATYEARLRNMRAVRRSLASLS